MVQKFWDTRALVWGVADHLETWCSATCYRAQFRHSMSNHMSVTDVRQKILIPRVLPSRREGQIFHTAQYQKKCNRNPNLYLKVLRFIIPLEENHRLI